MRWLIAIAVVVAALGALAAAAVAQRLPRRRPADFQVTWQWNDGPRGNFENVTLAAQSTYEGRLNGGGRVEASFALDAHALDALYAAVRAAGADRIHMQKRKGRIYDAGSASFNILAGGETWTIGDHATEVIAPRDRAKFDAVVAAIKKAMAGKVPASPPPRPDPMAE
jgi:hypothetical protein